MATIPIEVIVQDENSPTPTPTPDPGKNTNITVPDTGTGTVDSNSNNSFTNSSAAISIVSIVIAVLAIGAIVALLIRRCNKRKKANIEAGNNTRQERKAVVVTSTIAVLALTVLLGQLVVAGVVSPITTNAATDDTVSDEAELDVDSKITIIATRTEDENTTVATVKNTSTATSHQTFGYKVTAAMADNATTANLYLDGDETSEYYIAPVSNEGNGTLETNTWGYTTEETSEDYLPIPLATNPTTIVKGTNNIDNEPVDIYYTVQVDKDLPAGTYTGTPEYTLTDNNFPSTLTTMQGMTTEICKDTFTPGNQVTDPVPTATLTDTRDSKTYTIAKLADGNCWMTQNLDLDLDTNITFTPANTDISTNWTPERKTIAPDDLSTETWQYDQVHPYSYNPRDVYYYTSGSDDYDIKYNSLAECEAAGHTDCSHYHAGNYYNWSAAVASNNTSDLTEQYTVANTSVCPKGWRLPAGPESEDESSGEMYAMLANYSEIVEEGQYKAIRTKPFWLVRTGRVYYGGSVDEATRTGFYWTSTVQASGYSYELTFDHDHIRYLDYENKMAGLSIRCVAR